MILSNIKFLERSFNAAHHTTLIDTTFNLVHEAAFVKMLSMHELFEYFALFGIAVIFKIHCSQCNMFAHGLTRPGTPLR